jgi:hypothetical protein
MENIRVLLKIGSTLARIYAFGSGEREDHSGMGA